MTSEMLLSYIYLAVSVMMFLFQLTNLRTLVKGRAENSNDDLNTMRRGLVRTASSRVLVNAVYVFVGVVTVLHQSAMTTFSLIVFSSVQAIWVLNSIFDIRTWLGSIRSEPKHSVELRDKHSPTEREHCK